MNGTTNNLSKASNDDQAGAKKKKRQKYKMGRLYINVNHCHYPVVRSVAKIYNIKLTYSDEEDWDILWCDGAI